MTPLVGYRNVEVGTMDEKLPFASPAEDVLGDMISAPKSIESFYPLLEVGH